MYNNIPALYEELVQPVLIDAPKQPSFSLSWGHNSFQQCDVILDLNTKEIEVRHQYAAEVLVTIADGGKSVTYHTTAFNPESLSKYLGKLLNARKDALKVQQVSQVAVAC